jgi:hypothetical protein
MPEIGNYNTDSRDFSKKKKKGYEYEDLKRMKLSLESHHLKSKQTNFILKYSKILTHTLITQFSNYKNYVINLIIIKFF